jgi:hypothetical protein
VIAFLNDGRIDGKEVLAPAVIRALSTPRAKIPGGDGSYGYGVQVAKYRGVDLVSHGGSRAGYGSSIRMVPSKKFGVIAVANRTGIGLNATAVKAMEIALPLEASTTSTAAAATVTPADMNAYVGTYAQGPRTMDVLIRDGKLLLKQNDRETPLVKFGDHQIGSESGGRWVVVRGSNGAVEYLHAGSRSWRKVN